MNAEYFFRAISNECFKIKHKVDGQNFLSRYNDYHNSNKEHIEYLTERFNKVFQNSQITAIKFKDVKEYKVFSDLQKLFKNINITKVSQGQILKVTNYNIYLLYKAGKSYTDVMSEVLSIFNKSMSSVKIIDAKIGNFTKKPYYQIEDKYKNKFNVYIESISDYILQRNGTLDGYDSNMLS